RVVHRRPLEELPLGDHLVKGVVVDEVVVTTIDLAGARRARRRGDAQQHVGVVVADVARHGALADRGRSREHDEATARRHGAFALLEPVVQLRALAAAETADALGIRDAELVHDARDARGADARDAREQFAHPEGALRTRRVLPGGLCDIERTALASMDALFDARPRTPRRDGSPAGRRAVDLRHAHLGHDATSCAAASMAAAIPSGPASRITREALGITAGSASAKVAGASAND